MTKLLEGCGDCGADRHLELYSILEDDHGALRPLCERCADEELEEVCDVREDVRHCKCWYEGEGCCGCGKP